MKVSNLQLKLPFLWPVAAQALLIGFMMACSTTPQVQAPPFVNPPIAALAPEYGLYTFDASKGGSIHHTTGTTICIPAGALVDSSGNPVTGEVQVKYREFHDDVDIFLSGIPMDYDSSGAKQNLQSAGMFDLRVEQNGRSLSLAPGAKAEVKMASWQEDADYNFYRLDESARNWAYLGTNQPEVNENREYYKDKIKKMTPRHQHPFVQNYFAFNYASMLDVHYRDDWRKINAQKNQRPILQKGKDYGLECYNITNYDWIKYKGQWYHANMMVWKNRGTQSFPKWIMDSPPNTLKHKWGNVYEFKAVNPENAKLFKVDIECIMPLKSLYAFSPDYWKQHYDEVMAQVEEEHKRMEAEAAVFRSFQVNEFGIYNWDRLMKEEDRVVVHGDFRYDSSLNPELGDPVVYYLPGNRTVIKLPKERWDNVVMLPSQPGRFVAVIGSDKLAVFTPQQFAQIPFEDLRQQTQGDQKPDYTFAMGIQEKAISSKEELKNMLGM